MVLAPPALAHPQYLSLGSGNLHSDSPEWLFHDVSKHHVDIRLSGDLEEVDRDTSVRWSPSTGYVFELESGYAGGMSGEIQFCKITARDVLEHISPRRFLAVMECCWNLLTPGGLLKIQVPEWGSPNAVMDPTHYRGFHLNSFDILDPLTDYGRKNTFYSDRRWKVCKRKRVLGTETNLRINLRKVDGVR